MTKICARCKKHFATYPEYTDHMWTFKHTYKQMNPAEKAAIVTRIERTLSAFLLGYGTAEKIKMPQKLVIERFGMNSLPDPVWVG